MGYRRIDGTRKEGKEDERLTVWSESKIEGREVEEDKGR